MKLVSFTHEGSTRAGILDRAGDVVDLGAPMIDLLSDGALGPGATQTLPTHGRVSIADVRLEAPVPRPPKVLAIGLNYRDHAEESGQQVPQRPVVFAKMPTCIVGPGHPVYVPRVSRAVDWEAELCFVVGKRARHVKATDASAYIAGYCIGNDVSVRDWQFHSPTWMMGKSFDTHGPIGPWLATPDELDPGGLDVRLWVNGDLKQQSNTKQLIFNVGDIFEYLSTAFTLEPGDVVFTGTPAGVGVSRKPPEFLKPGDTVRIEIDGLGVLENPVAEEPA